MSNINWYPGHMVKAKRMVRDHLKLVDVVLELLDARLPHASRNPDIAALIGDKPHLIILNKADLADPVVTRAWQETLKGEGRAVLPVAATGTEGMRALPQVATALAQPALDKWRARGRLPRATRLMMVGIPNVGKSTLINSLAGKGNLKVADRPGVTRQQQWVRIRSDLDLLDMPGILMPRLGDDQVGIRLAASGAISDAVYDMEEVSRVLALMLREGYPQLLKSRYQLEELPDDGWELLEAIGRRRGALVHGGKVDFQRTAQQFIDEFRGGKIGRISLERPSISDELA